MEPIYVRSIMSMIFTGSGEIVTIQNEENGLDTMPQYFYGHREDGAKRDVTRSMQIINGEMEYKDEISYFFGAQSSNYSDYAIQNNFLIPNMDAIIDCGEFYEPISKSQIEEMTRLSKPSFIRIGKDTYDTGKEEGGHPIINDISIRYIVLPEALDLEKYKNFRICSIKELKELEKTDGNLISDRMRWFLNGDKLEKIKAFQEKLQETTKKANCHI